ncbi:MAG: hypothetical protein HOP30_14955 [Cyclobacteriaceae bacterium]|nr:hypothetical protein [Cyclobacteriaceae bacterium]
MKRKILLILLTACSLHSAYSQKVKYKDLIVLLEAKQFEKAEPFLRRYLKENPDNASAILYMGMTLQEKAASNDVLKNTEILLSNCDSAVLFYDKAYNAITEKELKKNDEYYQSYSRRDLRTGEFVIKLSDVRLDLETRVKNLKDRKEKVRELKKNFAESEKLYTRSGNLFKEIQAAYETESAFYLRSDEPLVAKLKQLAAAFDSAVLKFDAYKAVLKQIARPGYNQQINLQEIVDMKKDGATPADFMVDDLRLWDYKRWSRSTVDAIQNVINPLRDRLISFDIALNKLHDKIKKDSVSVLTELAQYEDGLLYGQLRKYDPNPLPIDVFEMKKSEMMYVSNSIAHKAFRDTSNVKLRLSYLSKELANIQVLDSVTTHLYRRDLAKEAVNYQQFITKAYGTQQVLASYISSTLDFAKREKLRKQVAWERTMQATKWMISGKDSIPLFFDQTAKELNFKPLAVVEEKMTVGIHYQDSIAKGYVFAITPTRIADTGALFDLDPIIYSKRNLPVTKSIATADATANIYFAAIYSESKVEEKFPVTVARIAHGTGLVWSTVLKLDMVPTELSFNAANGELTVKITNGSESKIIALDKDGKQLQ